MVVRDRLMENFLPTIISGGVRVALICVEEHECRENYEEVEMGVFQVGMQYTMANQIEKPSLKQLV
jgi:hypothetical protein